MSYGLVWWAEMRRDLVEGKVGFVGRKSSFYQMRNEGVNEVIEVEDNNNNSMQEEYYQ